MDTKSRKQIRQKLTLTYTLLVLAFGMAVIAAMNIGAMRIFDANPAFDLPRALSEEIPDNPFGRGRQLLLQTLDSKEVFRETYEAFIEAEEENLERLRTTSLLILIPYTAFAYWFGYQIADNVLKPQEDAMDKQKQFVADASHELKTPLTKIQTHIDVLVDRGLRGEVDSDEYKETLELVGKFNSEMNELTEDLLLLSSTTKIKKGSHKISQLVMGILPTVEELADAKDLNLTVDFADDFEITANKSLIGRAISNLIENAIKYTEAGEITITSAINNGRKELTIKDTGIGIPDDKLERIFERFYRVDKSRSRKAGGSGLGLSIVKKIIDEHSFEISVKSIEGAGSEFVIYF
jgi:two-component system sensor histidine kinase CiaH